MRSTSMPALPAGFRFHPTDEELIVHYLMNQAASMACPVPIIAAVNIYKFNPWDLPAKALFGENEWYFFSPRDRKYPNGARPNRAAGSGYWKATGTDKAILSTPTSDSIGVKKALVFYRGKPPKGVKTDWIMHEYRLTAATAGKSKHRRGSSMRLDDWVLCRIYKKSNDFQHSSSDVQDQEEGSTVEEESLDIKETSPKSEAPAGDGQFRPMMTITKSCSLTDLLSTMDYAALSQLLLDGSSDAALEPPPSPLIAYATPPCQTINYESNVNNHINYESNVNNHINYESNVNNHINSQVETFSDYSANFNGLKRKRVLTDSAAFVEDGSNFTKKLVPRSDSRISNFVSYCNQQLADQSSFQYSGLLSHPFPLNQQLLLNNHLQMQ